MTHLKKIRAIYKNRVIEPLDKIDLSEGQMLEVEIKSIPSITPQLPLNQRRELIRKMRGSMKGTWGRTVEEVDAYIKSERESWNREF